MNINDLIALQPAISGALAGALSAGLLKGPIKTVENYWTIFVGHYAEEQLLMIQEKQKYNLELYRNDLANEISKIKPENFQEPALNILGPALEASKFYIDESEMRKMFSKLLASSMDKSKNNTIHNSFVDIIKQLSPLDATNLLSFSQDGPCPIARMELIRKQSHAKVPVLSNLFWKNIELNNINLEYSRVISSSLDNLKRLGLISIDYKAHLVVKDAYTPIKELPVYKEFIQAYTDFNDSSEVQENTHLKIENHTIIEGTSELTDFGRMFCESCI